MLHFEPTKIDPEYAKKWHESSTDFVHLYKDGKLLNDNLYRKGGMFNEKDIKKDYFMVLKYKEAFYGKSIMDMVNKGKKNKDKESSTHLEGNWVIIDKNGVKKKEFENSIHSPYLQGGQIYCINSDYYNIETGFYYGNGSDSSLKSTNFLFIDNKFTSIFDKNFNKENIGILKINIHDGTFEVFK